MDDDYLSARLGWEVSSIWVAISARCSKRDPAVGSPGVRRLVSMAPQAVQRVIIHLSYVDPFAALEWLCRVFGFTEVQRFDRGIDNLTVRLRGPDGGMVMISGRDAEFKAWMRERAPHFEEPSGRSWPLLTHAVTVIVDDVDAHFARAKREGAALLGLPKDQPWGVRSYAALDPEGHQWEFATTTASSSHT